MSVNTNKVCRVCKTIMCIVVSDPTLIYDTCILCYFVDVNKNTPLDTSNVKFELLKPE